MSFERFMRWALVSIAITGLAAGIAAALAGRPALADLCWTLATLPVIAGLAVSMTRDLLAGRLGVDAIALVSMSAAVALGQPLAGAVVALMYSGGNVLEDVAVARAERDLRSLVDRAPREAHRLAEGRVEEVPISAVAIGDRLLVHAGEVVPVDGVVNSNAATIDESALTGEPIPVAKARGAAIFSGSLNAGETFEMSVSALAGESTYAGIVRLVDRGADRQGTVRAAGRPLRADLPARHAWPLARRRLADLRRSAAQPRRIGGGDAVPADRGCTGRLHRRHQRRPRGAASWSRAARHSRRWRIHAHRAVRQDRNAHRGTGHEGSRSKSGTSRPPTTY